MLLRPHTIVSERRAKEQQLHLALSGKKSEINRIESPLSCALVQFSSPLSSSPSSSRPARHNLKTDTRRTVFEERRPRMKQLSERVLSKEQRNGTERYGTMR